jgi:hypothetical protein
MAGATVGLLPGIGDASRTLSKAVKASARVDTVDDAIAAAKNATRVGTSARAAHRVATAHDSFDVPAQPSPSAPTIASLPDPVRATLLAVASGAAAPVDVAGSHQVYEVKSYEGVEDDSDGGARVAVSGAGEIYYSSTAGGQWVLVR